MVDLLSRADEDEPTEEEIEVDANEEGKTAAERASHRSRTASALLPPHLDDLAATANSTCEELHQVSPTRTTRTKIHGRLQAAPIQCQRLETLTNTQNELRKSKII
jgi:hypothetical protein